MAFYSYLSTKIIIAFITKSYQDLFGVRSYINAHQNHSDKKQWRDNHNRRPEPIYPFPFH